MLFYYSEMMNNKHHFMSPDRFVRAEHYRYKYAKIGSPEARNGQWWTRKKIGVYLPPVSLNVLQETIVSMGWPIPKLSVKK